MYEKTKRGNSTKSKKESPDAKNPKAIILNWNIKMGECELKSYTLDQQRKPYSIKANCVQGLILLNFVSLEVCKSSSELARATGIPSRSLTAEIDQIVRSGILLSSDGKFKVNTDFRP